MADEKTIEAFERMSGMTWDDLQVESEIPADFDEKKAERHPNQDLEYYYVDLSVLDSPKSDIASMEHPYYALHTRRNRKPVVYKQTGIRNGKEVSQELRIYPSHYGMMNLRDKDIIIYAVSCLMDRKNKGLPVGPCVEFDLYKFFVSTNRSTGGSGYRDFVTSLKRLSGCRINTSISIGNKKGDKDFGMIDSWETYTDNPDAPPKTTSETECYSKKESKPDVPRGRVRITLSDYLFEAIREDEVLTLDRRYFLLDNLFERSLYSISRKFVGFQPFWKIGLELLRQKMGYTGDIYNFRSKIRQHEKKNSLPGYKMEYERKKDIVRFYKRNEKDDQDNDTQYPEILTEPETNDFYEVTTLPEDPKDIQEPDWMTDEGLLTLHKEPIPQKKVAIQETMPLEVILDEKKSPPKPEDLAAGIQSRLSSIEDILARLKSRDKK